MIHPLFLAFALQTKFKVNETIDFPQSTKVLQSRPPCRTRNVHLCTYGMTANNVFLVGSRLSRNVSTFLFGGKVWLGVLSGKTQPPVFVSGEAVFNKQPLKDRISAFLSEVKESIIEAWESLAEAAKHPTNESISLSVQSLPLSWVSCSVHWSAL